MGLTVTLRGERAYEFLDRLCSIAIPRIRDFRGLNPRSFDGRGNYSMGVREQVIFPEIDYDNVDQVRGLDVTLTTSAETDAEAFALLDALGMPFARDGRPQGFESLRHRARHRLEKRNHGQDIQDRAPDAPAEVQDAGLHALPQVRPAPRRLSQVRPLPDLPARARPQRLHPRHDEVELVSRMSMTSHAAYSGLSMTDPIAT